MILKIQKNYNNSRIKHDSKTAQTAESQNSKTTNSMYNHD